MSNSSGPPSCEQDQDAERVIDLPSNNATLSLGDDEYDTLLREASNTDDRDTGNIPKSDMQSVLEPCDASVLETLLQLLLQNDSSTSPATTKEPSELSTTFATESDRSALHVIDGHPGRRSTLGCLSNQQETVTSSEDMNEDRSEKALPSSTVQGASQVRSRNVLDPQMPVPSSLHETIPSTEQAATPSNFQISAAEFNNFQGETDIRKTSLNRAYENPWSKADNQSTLLPSNFNLITPSIARGYPTAETNTSQTQIRPNQRFPSNAFPSHSRISSVGNDDLDQHWLSPIETFVGGSSYGRRFHPQPAQWTGNVTSSQSEIPFSVGREPHLPSLSGSGHFPIDRQSEVNSNVENTFGTWPQNDAALTGRKRKRTPAIITEAESTEANNIGFVLPPKKKFARRKTGANVSDSSTFPASGLSVPLQGQMFPVRNTSEPREGKMNKTRKTMRAKRRPTKVIVCCSGEVLPVEIIKDMLGLEYDYPDDHQFPCLFQPCTNTVSRRERNVLSHFKAHLKNDGYRDGMEIPCSHCEVRCHSLHSISRHLRDRHSHSLRMSCSSCNATINRGTGEVIMRHLHTRAHVNLWQQLGLHWEIRDLSEVDDRLADDSGREDTEIEMNKGEFQEGSSTGQSRRLP
ncbi:hypothetical protein ACEPAG_3948 [Sanghuangporus baumii]